MKTSKQLLLAATILTLAPGISMADSLDSSLDQSWLPPVQIGDTEQETVLVGDMLVEKRAIENFNSDEIFTRGALNLDAQLWEDGVLPINFPRGTTPKQKELFMSACQEWEKVANIRCVEGHYKGRKLTLSMHKIGCFALYGMGTNFLVLKRVMNLDPRGCWGKPTIIHEIGHALGLIHEHQRADRDLYVSIHSENAAKGFLGLNLKINFGELDSRPLTPYDFFSIMHYSRTAYSKNGKDTIVPRPQYIGYIDVIGNTKIVSAADAFTLSMLYGPPTTN